MQQAEAYPGGRKALEGSNQKPRFPQHSFSFPFTDEPRIRLDLDATGGKPSNLSNPCIALAYSYLTKFKKVLVYAKALWLFPNPPLILLNRSPNRKPFGLITKLMMYYLFQGNMKQHMLTHKIRDMPQHMFENKTPSLSGDDSTPLPPSMPQREHSEDGDQGQQVQQPAAVPPVSQSQMPHLSAQLQEPKHEQSQVKREPTETELPLPKRPPSKFRKFLIFASKFCMRYTAKRI